MQRSISRQLGRIPGRAYLLIAVLIFAAANSVTRRIMDLGAQHLISGRNPISFCNVLFVGNLCALIALLAVYHAQLTRSHFQQLAAKDWWSLGGVAMLAGALAPALFFTALNLTSVNNVVLIGRIEPPLVLALSVFLLHERVNGWVIAGAVVSFVGVVLTIALQPPEPSMMQMAGMQVGRGAVMALGGAIAAAVASIISKLSLHQIPFGVFNVGRTVLATVVFFTVALGLFGPHHFADAFSPFLWQWMVIYGAIIVVGGQLSWFEGLKRTTAAEVALVSSFNPIAGILFAFFILGEVPTRAQYMGGAIILVGIAVNQFGVMRASSAVPVIDTESANIAELGDHNGFKGL